MERGYMERDSEDKRILKYIAWNFNRFYILLLLLYFAIINKLIIIKFIMFKQLIRCSMRTPTVYGQFNGRFALPVANTVRTYYPDNILMKRT